MRVAVGALGSEDPVIRHMRGHILKYITQNLRIYVSMLPSVDPQILAKFYGVEGQEFAASCADFIMVQLRPRPPGLPRVEQAHEPDDSPGTQAGIPEAGDAVRPAEGETTGGGVKRGKRA